MYPITYEADYVRERSRASVFFRYFLVIPWEIVLIVYAIAALFVWVIAFLVLLVIGRYPEGLYNFMAGFLRYSVRVNAFYSLQTDAWPPFGFSPDPTYPVRVNVPGPAEKQSRLKVLFRGLLAIPLLVVGYAISFIHLGAMIASWLTIVFRGYQPAGIHNALAYTLGFNTRIHAYLTYLTDAYPPVGDEGPQAGDVRPPAQPAAPAAPPPTPPPPAG